MNRELFYVENSKIPVSSTERRPYSYGPLETFDVADDRVRVPRQGPPEPIAVEPSHGHVIPRADGVKARCGGPALCEVCRKEQERVGTGERVVRRG